MKISLALLLFFAAVPAWTAEIFTFNVLPSGGAIAGAPGETIGWGYSIQNQSTSDWLVPTNLSPGSFQFGTPDLLFDFPIIAPGTTVAVPFNVAASAGLMALTWNANAPIGKTEFGDFLLNAEWWDGNPLAGGSLAFAATPDSQPYSASIAAAPEPATITMIAVPLLAGLLRRRGRHSSKTSV